MVMEFLLLLTMMGLGGVLIFELREYRKIQKLAIQLHTLVNTYAEAYNTIAASITLLDSKQADVALEQDNLTSQLLIIRTILEIHNKALNLNPDILGIKNGDT